MKELPTVFIVDDDSAVLKSLEAVLKAHGYHTKCYSSAEEFISRQELEQVGCVLIDLLMPGMGGSELLRWLKESGSLLSIVITSGLVDSADVVREEEALAPLLEKPYEVSALLTMVADGIAGSLSRQAIKARGGKPG